MRKPYITFWPERWLSDIGLRACHPIARGFWIDMLCFMAQGNPYGHLQIKPPTTPTKKAAQLAALQAAVQAIPLPPARATAQATALAPAQATALAPALATTLAPAQATAQATALAQQRVSDVYNVPENGSLEPMLPQLLNASPELVEWAIDHLEAHNVFSRTDGGIIFSRKMVRDNKAHEEHVERGRNNQKKQQLRRNQAAHGKTPQTTPAEAPIVARPQATAQATARATAQAPARATAQATAQAPARANGKAPAQAVTPPITTSIRQMAPSPPTPPSASGKGGARRQRTDPKSEAIAILQQQEARRKR